MDALEFIAKYLVLPVGTLICTVGWYMLKKQNERIEELETRTSVTEKTLIEIKVELRKDIQYMAEDIKEIKQLLKTNR